MTWTVAPESVMTDTGPSTCYRRADGCGIRAHGTSSFRGQMRARLAHAAAIAALGMSATGVLAAHAAPTGPSISGDPFAVNLDGDPQAEQLVYNDRRSDLAVQAPRAQPVLATVSVRSTYRSQGAGVLGASTAAIQSR